MGRDDTKMRGIEFQRDMSSYIDKTSKHSNRFVNLKEHLDEKQDMDSDVVIIKEKTSFEQFLEKVKDIFKTKPDAEEEIEGEDVTSSLPEEEIEEDLEEKFDDEEKEYEEENSSTWLEKLLSIFKSPEEIEKEEEKEIEQNPDMKKIAIFAKKLLDKLPAEERKRLKEEGKIDEFKDLLRNNNIIK